MTSQYDGLRDDDPERHLPAHHNPLPELGDVEPAHPSLAALTEVQQSPEFAELKSRFRKFAFPMSAAFLIWYFLYVLLSCYAESFMNTKVAGELTVGLTLGLLQFATTFLITWLYIRHANRELDPIATQLRDRLEGNL